MGRVKFTSILVKKWVPETEKKIDAAVLDAATDIHRVAGMLAPRDKGNLISSGRIVKDSPAHYTVIFGGNTGGFSVPYGKRRHYENNKNPQTLKYLERAGEATARNFDKYLRDI